VFADVRGCGLMLGLKCTVPAADVVAAGLAQDLLTVPAADNVVRLLPPLTITDAEVLTAMDRLDAAAAGLRVVAPERVAF
jgi:acetylornithine/N-succinyldiaminopimelate aminotransferase